MRKSTKNFERVDNVLMWWKDQKMVKKNMFKKSKYAYEKVKKKRWSMVKYSEKVEVNKKGEN